MAGELLDKREACDLPKVPLLYPASAPEVISGKSSGDPYLYESADLDVCGFGDLEEAFQIEDEDRFGRSVDLSEKAEVERQKASPGDRPVFVCHCGHSDLGLSVPPLHYRPYSKQKETPSSSSTDLTLSKQQAKKRDQGTELFQSSLRQTRRGLMGKKKRRSKRGRGGCSGSEERPLTLLLIPQHQLCLHNLVKTRIQHPDLLQCLNSLIICFLP